MYEISYYYNMTFLESLFERKIVHLRKNKKIKKE